MPSSFDKAYQIVRTTTRLDTKQVPKEQIPKADTFECSAAVHWQEAEKGKIPMCKLCPNCSQDLQLMSLVSHNCPTSNQDVSLMSLQSCESCGFHANYICKRAYCSVASDQIKQQIRDELNRRRQGHGMFHVYNHIFLIVLDHSYSLLSVQIIG